MIKDYANSGIYAEKVWIKTDSNESDAQIIMRAAIETGDEDKAKVAYN
jgi:hypothetical protein